MKKHMIFMLILLVNMAALSQQPNTIQAKIIDADSKEPLIGAIITDLHAGKTIADAFGNFSLRSADSLIHISYSGYQSIAIRPLSIQHGRLALKPSNTLLQQVVVSASRTASQRSEAPLAISIINKQTINDAKANRVDFLLNKVSGVFMVNLGNEQHEMSIRQPMSTKSVFLYLEDGLPIRTTGVYNHNALLEMNMPAAKSIEVIKGPSSAMYGAEAIAGAVNIITQSAPAYSNGMGAIQINNSGYKRADFQLGGTSGKFGVLVSGYYANRKNGPVDYSDFHKSAITIRTDYKPTDKTIWTNTISYVDYYSDMTGALDSLKFSQKNYSTPQTFTYRSVNALRVKSMLHQDWNPNSATSIAFLYRNNEVKQNPSYSIGSTSNPLLFKGQINSNAFSTFALFVQHVQKCHWMNSKLVAGLSTEISPQQYWAKFLWIDKDPLSGAYAAYRSPAPDSMLSRYHTGISNMAGYANVEMSPIKNIKLVAAIRLDAFKYDFNNELPVSATSGGPSSVTNYQRWTPKIGFTYNRNGIGVYGNYAEGYVPPQITELFNSVKTPYLQPQSFHNIEIGGWLSLVSGKFYADWSLYRMTGSDEIISVRQSDGTSINQNAGKTEHLGMEYGIHYRVGEAWSFRWSATNAKHLFVDNIVKGVDYSGKEMSAAPRFISNAEVIFKPQKIKGLKIGAEWQHQGRYFMDDLDWYQYKGFDVLHLRFAYQMKSVECWVNALNVLDQYYATLVTKSSTSSGSASYSYNLGDPREISVGVSFRFGKN